jgi:hypothetical protein
MPFTQSGPHPIAAGGGRIAFVENQINDFEHSRKTSGQFLTARRLERHLPFSERPFGAHDALCHG